MNSQLQGMSGFNLNTVPISARQNVQAIVVFILCLIPITIVNGDGIGISANYSFIVLLPLLVGLRFKYNSFAVFATLSYIFCYLTAFIFNVFILQLNENQLLRVFISFTLATASFVILFLDLRKYERQFYAVVVAVSVVYSICVFVAFVVVASDSGINPFMMKNQLPNYLADWPQRYVLVLFAGFFFTPLLNIRPSVSVLLRLIILSAIALTFLRAAYLALFVGFILELILTNRKKNIKIRRLRFHQKVFFNLLLVFLIVKYLPVEIVESLGLIISYLGDSIANIFLANQTELESDSIRVDIITNALSRINPLIGLGGGGIYLVYPEAGSAHNQILHAYIRFGILGVFIFLSIIVMLLKRYIYSAPVVGLIICYLIFGFAHETLKYSYGAFIMLVLLSISESKRLSRSKNRFSND